VVVGSVNVDLVVRIDRLPEPGETVTGGSFHRVPGGKGGNAAAAAARLGRARIVGLVGPDDLGEEARRDLAAAGVDVGSLGTGRAPTGVASILVDADGRNVIAVASGANAELPADHVRDSLSAMETDRAVVVANLEIPDRSVSAAAETAGLRGWPFVLNPAPARPLPHGLAERCAVVIANELEAEALGLPGSLGGGGAAIVTRGLDGADLHRPGRPVHRQAGFPVEVVDTTGAGDAFVATLAWSLLKGSPLEQGVRLACAAGALACRGLGARAGLADRSEVEALAGPAS
ncbi:MAG: PfkB family carbohydrate kinase, partial [Actinomycetota bacterium]